MQFRIRSAAAIVASSTALVALAIPTSAAACPSLANVRSFTGTASASFSQAATKEEYDPGLLWAGEGTWHGAFGQSAMALQLKSLTPPPASPNPSPKVAKALGTHFLGPTGGGAVSVKNSLVEYGEGGAAASETYSGPVGLNGHHGGESMIQFGGRLGSVRSGPWLGCRYAFTLNYNVHPTVLIKPPDQGSEVVSSPGLVITARSPATPTTGLHLSGEAEVPAEEVLDLESIDGGYQFGSPAFAGQLSDLSDGQLDRAVLRWNLKPVYRKSHK